MAIRITRVYTRTGDKGTTALVGGARVPKDSGRVACYGEIDELNAVIGLARSANADAAPSPARDRLEEIAAQRLGLVVHALAEGGAGEGLGLADCGWGLLFSGGVHESMDLALIARRAAEDCGTPFIVVHESGAVRFTEPASPPTRELCETYVGPAGVSSRRCTRFESDSPTSALPTYCGPNASPRKIVSPHIAL